LLTPQFTRFAATEDFMGSVRGLEAKTESLTPQLTIGLIYAINMYIVLYRYMGFLAKHGYSGELHLYWVRVSDLDKLVRRFRENGLCVGRHSYSYRLFYKGKVVAGLHLYPGYREASLRLYRVHRDLAEAVRELIIMVIRDVFPDYKIVVKWYPPGNP